MAGLKRVETPFQKYNRLLNELNSLKSDLEHDSEEQKVLIFLCQTIKINF